MKRKLIISILMAIACLSASAEDFEVDGISYGISTGSGGNRVYVKHVCSSGDVTIPSTVTCNGVTYTVWAIGDEAFQWHSNLTSVTLPHTLQLIGKRAFEYCEKITSISIPEGVTYIGENAFFRCDGLTRITIPSTLKAIASSAFAMCGDNVSVFISDIAAWCKDAYRNAPCGRRLYLNGKEIKNLVIPNSVTSIREKAFNGCTSLTSVTIPNSVTSINGEVFLGCTSLTSVTIPNSVTSIEGRAFEYCSGLTSVTIPNSVTSIGHEAFSNTGIKKITLPASLRWASIGAFRGMHQIYLEEEWPQDMNFGCYSGDEDLFSMIELYVPTGSYSRYLYHPVWGKFEMIKEYTPRKAKAAGGTKKKSSRRR